MKEVDRLEACSVSIGPDGIEPAHDIPGGDLITDLVGHELDLKRIDFDQVPWLHHPVVLSFLTVAYPSALCQP